MSKLKDVFRYIREDLMPGGKGDDLSPEDIANKTGRSVDEIKRKIKLGTKTEMEEHGLDRKRAEEVTKDHLIEDPDHYERE